MSRKSIYRWIARYRKSHRPQALGDRKGAGRPSSWIPERLSCMEVALKHSPRDWGYWAWTWTAPLLRAHFLTFQGWWPSDEIIRRKLHALGQVWKRPRYVLAPDPDREKNTLAPACVS